MTRYLGVFPRIASITKSQSKKTPISCPPPISYCMTWAERLKGVFKIDIEVCRKCGSKVKITASIKDPLIINKILTHLDLIDEVIPAAFQLPKSLGPPPEFKLDTDYTGIDL
ncbi:MAG: hypothetical protein HRU20_02575 [Pseudomonadales bacterium]|nr:hypothetical protein [Pseudomonadales bacterium]